MSFRRHWRFQFAPTVELQIFQISKNGSGGIAEGPETAPLSICYTYKLTTTEFLIVKELAKRPGVIKERAHLMDIAYKENTEIEDRTIDSHVKRIRKKFKKVDEKFSAIETRYGSGYRWNVS